MINENGSSLLNIHSTLAYLEVILKDQYYCTQNTICYNESIDFCFYTNDKGLFDLFISCKTYKIDSTKEWNTIAFEQTSIDDIDEFFKNLGITKQPDSIMNNFNCEYRIYENFTQDEIKALFMYFKIKLKNLSNVEIDFFDKNKDLSTLINKVFTIPNSMKWPDLRVIRTNHLYSYRLYIRDKALTDKVLFWINQLDPELKVKTTFYTDINSLYGDYAYYIDLDFNKDDYFGFCHLIKDIYKIRNI